MRQAIFSRKFVLFGTAGVLLVLVLMRYGAIGGGEATAVTAPQDSIPAAE